MPGKKFHQLSQTHASAQPYLAACSGWLQPEVPGPPSRAPSIHEAPATRKHAARLVRVAYHMARCWMGAPGWTSRWPVVAGAAQLLSLPQQQQQQQAEQGQASHQHRQAGRCAEIGSVQPRWCRQASSLQYNCISAVVYDETLHYWRCYTWPLARFHYPPRAILHARAMASAQALFSGA